MVLLTTFSGLKKKIEKTTQATAMAARMMMVRMMFLAVKRGFAMSISYHKNFNMIRWLYE